MLHSLTGPRLLFVFIATFSVLWALTPRMYSAPTLRAALDPAKGYLLAPLLKPRVPGTIGALKARNHIMDQLSKARWSVQKHEFIAATPDGAIPMANIVARRSSSRGPSKLTLAAHYDSKKYPEGFVGAIDSAFPCALLMYLATVEKSPTKDFDLIFFDGEEAFKTWSEDDSIYGARALAHLQEKQDELPETLVLLDLLGNEARFPIPSWFAETEHLHKELASINPKLVGGRPVHEYAGYMQDDHIPYLQRGVPILHLIPPSFPDSWHTLDDNASSLHWDSMVQWAELFETWLYD